MKNIVVLSDGTGNGAAKRHRTNVWRLYSALDLRRGDQIAFYDDGVGSQEFLPLKILGGAIGFGLKRNVIELYKFLCRTYEPGDDAQSADKIYLFGFSRGAFTVRVLAGMIAYCGLCTEFGDEDDLNRKATRNYNAFRSCFKRGYLWRAYRFLTGASSEAKYWTIKPNIEFIGVWDTVDAYGLPIDELAILWDLLIFPIRFPDCQLSEKVQRACHALSIDDERLTFHPVLWDERGENTDRIEQVWFAGVHSDVGGGYPMCDLALVTLEWMISRVEATKPKLEKPGHEKSEYSGLADGSPTHSGLHFIPSMRDEIFSHSDWHGVQHDSRSGFAAYYRYKPRNIEHICNDPDNDVHVNSPKIHRSVFERIRENAVPYAPTGLPASYEIVATEGEIPDYETPDQSAARAEAANKALDVVYWRRWLYAALLASTLVLLTSRFFLPWTDDGICKGSACAIDPLLELTIAVLPDFAAGWFEALRQNPPWLWGFVITFVVFFTLKGMAWRKTRLESTRAWAALKGRGSPPEWKPTLTSKLRGLFRSKRRTAIKWTAAALVFALILVLLLTFAGRASFHARSTLGLLCAATPSAALSTLAGSESVTLDISNPCFATGLTLEEGKTYRMETDPGGEWLDGPYPAGPEGYTAGHLAPWTLLRRSLSEPWLKLMGQIGDSGKEHFAIGSCRDAYTAKSSGELFLYVNDGVFGFLPSPYWAWPYFWERGQNQGRATITVTRIPNSDGPACATRPRP